MTGYFAPADFAGEIGELFHQRTRLCLWMGAVFFLLFALLDFIYCRPQFGLFVSYRLTFVAVALVFVLRLGRPGGVRHAPLLIWVAMLLGTMAISLMTVALGGFTSGYYVGILLMIAGAIPALPLSGLQALALGSLMYLIYLLTVLHGAPPQAAPDVARLVGNSFFFAVIVLVTAVQRRDDMKTLSAELRAKSSLRQMRHELREYRDNLETLVERRLAQLAEADLRFRDLYHTIHDLVVLIDTNGVIRMINRHGGELLGRSAAVVVGRPFADFIMPADRASFAEVLQRLCRDGVVQGVQLRLQTGPERIVDVELSGGGVDLPGGVDHCQLTLRDISATKEIEQQTLAARRLIDASRQVAILGLARLAECRDSDTGAHLLRIRAYTRLLAESLAGHPDLRAELTEEYIEDVCLCSVLHDIGKVGIPDTVLLKPGRLNEAELAAMQRHCDLGSLALSSAERDSQSLSFLRCGQEIARYHHERWDGGGYPCGLAGNAIPLAARIVTLADVYDALTSRRPYKPAFSHEEARRIIVGDSGQRFDPIVVNAFLSQEQAFQAARVAHFTPADDRS
ncbi:MAG: HD domain-containing phosphohydrolase [Desulfobulbus sp.]|nr:HD domain-containing phosphohydrolase [Desulfobulbus sp.]